jgi:hypothetical protein
MDNKLRQNSRREWLTPFERDEFELLKAKTTHLPAEVRIAMESSVAARSGLDAPAHNIVDRTI